jgi:hypothetical protein
MKSIDINLQETTGGGAWKILLKATLPLEDEDMQSWRYASQNTRFDPKDLLALFQKFNVQIVALANELSKYVDDGEKMKKAIQEHSKHSATVVALLKRRFDLWELYLAAMRGKKIKWPTKPADAWHYIAQELPPDSFSPVT